MLKNENERKCLPEEVLPFKINFNSQNKTDFFSSVLQITQSVSDCCVSGYKNVHFGYNFNEHNNI